MGSPVNAGFVHNTDQLWELGLPAIAVGQSPKILNALAPSRASSPPQGISSERGFRAPHRPTVGASLLAIAVDQSPKMLNALAPSRAGSLLHGISSGRGFRAPHRPTVGARLARDSGGSVTEDVECLSPIASKLTPTEIYGGHGDFVGNKKRPRPCGRGRFFVRRESYFALTPSNEMYSSTASEVGPRSFCLPKSERLMLVVPSKPAR